MEVVNEKGPHAKPDKFKGGCMADLINSHSENNHTEGSEHKRS